MVLVLTLCITVTLCCVKKRQSKYLIEHAQRSRMELDTVPRTNTYEGISYKNLEEEEEDEQANGDETNGDKTSED